MTLLLQQSVKHQVQSLSTKQSRPQRVAIIGGGVAGLSCAQALSNASSQYEVTVFDTGRLRPGGRLSSRLPGDKPKEQDETTPPSYRYFHKCIVDHTAQIISAGNDPQMKPFAQQLKQWEQEGVVHQFPPHSLYNIAPIPNEESDDSDMPKKNKTPPPKRQGFQLQPFPSDTPFYHGSQGNGGIPLAMSTNANFNLVQDCWVSPGNGARYMTKSNEWKLQASGQVLGYFDQLIIAHNGKCADRLMSKTPATEIHNLLRVNFASSAPQWGGKRMTLNSLYSLTIALPAGVLDQVLPSTFISGAIQNAPALRFLTLQTRKYPNADLAQDKVEVWTILSSPTFAKKHKAPQEFIPPEKDAEVTGLLLRALEQSLDLADNVLVDQVLESRLQLWGAAVPLNTWQNGGGYLYDADHAVGVCGDWLVQPSVAGAWTSGQNLAQHMLMLPEMDDPIMSFGLDGQFVQSPGAHKGGIASFQEEEGGNAHRNRNRNRNRRQPQGNTQGNTKGNTNKNQNKKKNRVKEVR